MKTSYKRLLVFEIIMLIILMLNSFVSSILKNYGIVIFLIIFFVVFYKEFGYEKDKSRYSKDISLIIVIFLLEFFILYYLLGVVIGFAKTNNYYSLYALTTIVIPVIITVVLTEILRYMILRKAEGSRLLLIVSILVFTFLNISTGIYYAEFSSKYSTFVFLALTVLPAINVNIFCTYLVIKSGYKPAIIYQLIMGLYGYFVPIIPNSNTYLLSVIYFILPAICGYKIYKFFDKDKEEELDRDYHKKRKWDLVIPTIIVVVLVYFTSGYFHYYAIAIASGSMTPNIYKGDVVIIEKIDEEYEKLKEGQVIAYQYDDIIVVHRISRILKNEDKYYFYTKGDANSEEDNYIVEKEKIIGVVNLKIPYIGIPTIWLNEL